MQEGAAKIQKIIPLILPRRLAGARSVKKTVFSFPGGFETALSGCIFELGSLTRVK
jgi:hypothetical protein